jgi:DNA-binding LacI/PurR family transcriptional regulator
MSQVKMVNKRKTRILSIQKVATIRQVAEMAGVSIATVSRVFAGSDLVSRELVERVQAAAHSVNYQPNRIARNLRTQKTHTAAVVVSDIENPFFTSVIRGAERVLRNAGYTLLLTNSDEDEQLELEHLLNLRAEGVAGVILAPTHEDPKRYEQFLQAGLVIVAIDRCPMNLKIDRVTVNNIEGAQTAVRHLIDQGHTKIGFVTGLPKISTAFERLLGFEQAMKIHNLPVNPQWVQQGNFRRENGFKAMMDILKLEDRPTAVISANNLMTLGALQAIYECKLHIPADIAIVGFDDMAWASSLNPPLTTIAQPTHELGSVAAQLLLDRINDPQRPFRHVILDTQLIVRESSGVHYVLEKN